MLQESMSSLRECRATTFKCLSICLRKCLEDLVSKRQKVHPKVADNPACLDLNTLDIHKKQKIKREHTLCVVDN
jgi:hypothetical protein